MTSGKRRFLGILASAFLLVIIICLVAAGAYWLGRNSATEHNNSLAQTTRKPQEMTIVRETPDRPESTEVGVSPTRVEDDSPGSSETLPSAGYPEINTDQAAQTEGEALESTPPTVQPTRGSVEFEEADFQLIEDVWEIINREFDGTLPDSTDVTYGAIMGSMELLDDRFTRFIPADVAERARIQIQGGYEGIGAYVDLDDDGNLLIIRPIDGQPADRAGLLSEDVVTQVDGKSITGLPVDEIVAMITGPEGTVVTLTVRRDSTGETFDLDIVRERIEIAVVSSEMLDEDIGYVRLSTFSNGADQQLSAVIQDLLDQNAIGLILDLRDNPGGLLSQAISVGDLFLTEGIVAYQRNNKGEETVFESDDGDLAEQIPLVVLVNRGSASASEIVSGAIQDLGRGLVIGEPTLGKGSVQGSYTLEDGSELRVTIARWYTPDNESITDQGIIPDIEIETPENLGGENDPQLQRAIDAILELQQ